MRTFINTVGIVAVILVLLSFAMENTHCIQLHYFDITWELQLWQVILIPFFVGVLSGNLLDVIQRFRLKNEIRKLKREFKVVRPE